MDIPETPDYGGEQPRLTPAQLALLESFGERVAVTHGDFLYRPGDPSYDFYVVFEGAVAIAPRPRTAR